ncbi:MAG: arylsulfatase [Rikenellaceae bacterium]
MKSKIIKYGIPSLMCLGGTSCHSQKISESTKDMNVVLILTDDQGYGDLGFTGNPYIKTPNIDKLAAESYRFTNYHTCTNSAPTRSGLMTGQYNNRVGVWHTILGRELLSLEETTLPEVFQDNGYATAMYGKWHLGDNSPYRPYERGFDETLWHQGGGVGQTPDFWENDYFDDTYLRNETPTKVSGYCTDVFFENAKEFITRKAKAQEKFFCYISTNAPHAPRHIEERYVEPYRGNDEIVNPPFYGMIANIDENVGALDELLTELGIDDNTIVIFSTDNGSAGASQCNRETGIVERGYNAGMRGRKGLVWDGGHRVPFIIRIPGQQAKACDIDQLFGYIDVAPTLYNLLGMEYDREKSCDGIDISSIFDNTQKRFDRYLVVDTQREELLDSSNPSCVMRENWRLVNRTELYDVTEDVGQNIDVAAENPVIVEELNKIYEQWWQSVSINADKMNAIPLYAPSQAYVSLNSHDRHDLANRKCAAEQTVIRSDFKAPVDTFWATTVPEDGLYTFRLYRWPIESNLGIYESAHKGGEIPNGKPYLAGHVFENIVGGEIKIGEVSLQKRVDNREAKYIEFADVALKAGEYNLYANFLSSDAPFGAQYVIVTKN